MQFTIVDGGVALVLFVSGVLAYSRGITRELLAIAGWIIAAIAAVYFAPMMEPVLKEIPVVGEFLNTSCSISKLAAVAAVFALALIVLSIFTPLFSLKTPLVFGPNIRHTHFIQNIFQGLLFFGR